MAKNCRNPSHFERFQHAMVVLVSSLLNFHLERYEGPLDLLLDLIKKQQVNIYDIPIAQITSQYLAFLQKATELDIELSSEFVFMAATLIHIKSKMLLPRDPELDRISPEEDPRTELVERLIEHERFKNAAEMLQQKRVVEEAIWSNPQIELFLQEDEGPGLAVSIFDLVKTFQDVLERLKNRPIYEIGKEDVSVPDMVRYLRDQFEKLKKDKTLSTTKLFEQQRSRRAMICLFLAILEMVKRQAVELVQGEAFGDIALRRHESYDQAFLSEDLTAVEQDYQ
jgi:segregation and condensation protein A